MSAIHKLTDALPGGEARAEGRQMVEQATTQSKAAKAQARAVRETFRPIRTKTAWFLGASLLVGTIFYLSKNDGGEAIGEAVSDSAKTGVQVVAGVGSVGVDVATGVISGTKEGVDQATSNIDIPLDNPLTLDDDQPVSNTVVPSAVPVEAPKEYIVVAGDGPGSIARLCGSVAITMADKESYYATVIVPLSPNLQDGMPNPGDIAVCR